MVPAAYLLSFTCFGTRVAGEDGSSDRFHNAYSIPRNGTAALRDSCARMLLSQPAYTLNAVRREITLEAIENACRLHRWHLLAAHVRSDRVHVIVAVASSPADVMNALKTSASHALNQAEGDHKRWSARGSTQPLWTRQDIASAVDRVAFQQGEPMSIFIEVSAAGLA